MTENQKINEIKELILFLRKQEKNIFKLSENMITYRLLYNTMIQNLEKIINKES